MQIAKKTWAAAVLAIALAGQAGAEDVTADTVVATVGGQEITVGHMIVAKSTLPQQFQTLPDETLFPGILDQLIQQSALAQSIEDEVSKATMLAIANQRTGLLAGEAIGIVAQEAVTDEALQAAYAAAYETQEPEREFNASHILVETEDEAKAIKAELDGGADFAEMAKAKSTGPSGPNGGALGWFGKGMMVPEFEAAVTGLADGEISEPVKTKFGWHIVILNESRLKEAPPLDEVRGELAAGIEEEAIQAHIAAVTDAADVVRAEIEVDPAVLSNVDLITD